MPSALVYPMRSVSMAALAAARTATGAAVDGWPAERSTVGRPAACRATTASMTRMTWNGGTPARAAADIRRCVTVPPYRGATLAAARRVGPRWGRSDLDRSATASIFTRRAVEQAGVDQIPPQRGDVVPHLAQDAVHLELRVAQTGLEPLGQVLQDREPAASGARHHGQPPVAEVDPEKPLRLRSRRAPHTFDGSLPECPTSPPIWTWPRGWPTAPTRSRSRATAPRTSSWRQSRTSPRSATRTPPPNARCAPSSAESGPATRSPARSTAPRAPASARG